MNQLQSARIRARVGRRLRTPPFKVDHASINDESEKK